MDKSLTRLITLLARKSQLCIANALKKYNLTAAEQPFFMALRNNEGITQDELTSIVCVDKSAATRAIKSLEQKGYIKRVQDEKDKRQNRVYQTEKAKQIGNKVVTELLELNAQITEGIDHDQIEIIYNALVKMNENSSEILNKK